MDAVSLCWIDGITLHLHCIGCWCPTHRETKCLLRHHLYIATNRTFHVHYTRKKTFSGYFGQRVPLNSLHWVDCITCPDVMDGCTQASSPPYSVLSTSDRGLNKQGLIITYHCLWPARPLHIRQLVWPIDWGLCTWQCVLYNVYMGNMSVYVITFLVYIHVVKGMLYIMLYMYNMFPSQAMGHAH